jgi:hypothetical protein
MNEEECKGYHNRVVASAEGRPFMEALNGFHYYNFHHRMFGPLPKCEAIDVAGYFPDKTKQEIDDAINRLKSVYADAEKMCFAMSDLPKEEKIKMLRAFVRANSDLSEEIRSLAIFYGGWCAR